MEFFQLLIQDESSSSGNVPAKLMWLQEIHVLGFMDRAMRGHCQNFLTELPLISPYHLCMFYFLFNKNLFNSDLLYYLYTFLLSGLLLLSIFFILSLNQTFSINLENVMLFVPKNIFLNMHLWLEPVHWRKRNMLLVEH